MFKKKISTKSNIFFNFAGRIWVALAGILFVPIYLRYLGVEAFGIIGFFAGLQAILSLFDIGISPTLSREVARLSAFPGKTQEIHDLSWTLEILCWSAAVLMGAVALLFSPLVANYWLQPKEISPEIVTAALMLMSVNFVFQWMINFYSGGLMGLQQQKLYNLLNSVGVTFRAVGAVVVLAFVSATIQAFLLWQGLATMLMAISMAIAYRKCLPPNETKARFRAELMSDLWKYAAGMTGISVVALILTQTDKIILSRLLTLENFGYYILAATLAGTAVGTITGAVTNAYFPRFSQIVALEDDQQLREIYHQSSQIMSVILMPVAAVIACFSFQILMLWTRNEEIAKNTYLLLSLISIGSGLHGLMQLPYYVQLANGLTKLAFWQNVAAIILLIPFLIYATLQYGAVGGALTWLLLNLLYISVGMQIMHRILLKGELKKWFLKDVLLPLLATLAIVPISAFLLPANASVFLTLLWIGTTWICAALFSIFTSVNLRKVFLETVKSKLYAEKFVKI